MVREDAADDFAHGVTALGGALIEMAAMGLPDAFAR